MSADLASQIESQDAMRIRRLLIATDLGEASEGAVHLGADLARAFGAEVLVVHVLADVGPRGSVKAALGMEPGDLLERRAGEAEARLHRLEALLGRGHTHACVRCGSAGDEILRLARATAADLIVLGWHGRDGRDACAEPVAERVRSRAPCPVVVAVPRRGGDAGPGGPSIRGVLVAADLTARSDAAVRWGQGLGRRLGCPVHVVHALASGRRPRTGRPAPPAALRRGDPAARVVACAQELGDDLIVLGAPRPGGLWRTFHRDVGRDVVARGACSTLTVR